MKISGDSAKSWLNEERLAKILNIDQILTTGLARLVTAAPNRKKSNPTICAALHTVSSCKQSSEPRGASRGPQGGLQPETRVALISYTITPDVEGLNLPRQICSSVKREGCLITCLF